ncbi:unnamed protein product [Gordionus sp. m RMFG-2023]
MIGIINVTIKGNLTQLRAMILKEIMGEIKEPNSKLLHYLGMVIALGILGNLLMMFLVIAARPDSHVQQRCKFYFVTLALANMSILIVMTPWVVHDIKKYKMQYTLISSVWFGKFEWFFEDIFIGFINYLLALMSMDRLFAIKFPFLYFDWFKFLNVKKYVCVIMVVSVIVALPYLNYYRIKQIYWFHQNEHNTSSYMVGGNDVLFNTSKIISNGTKDVQFTIQPFPDHESLYIHPTYRFEFNEQMKKFSLIYDKMEAVFTNLIPCIIILTSNAITATLFYKRSRTNIKRSGTITIPSTDIEGPSKNNPFSGKYWHSKILSSYKKCARSTPKTNINSIFPIPNDLTSIHPSSSNEIKFDNSKQSKLIQHSSKGNQVLQGSSPLTTVNTASSRKNQLIKARNRDFTISTGCLCLASVIFSLPWLIFIFRKLPTWEDDFLMTNPVLFFFVYIMMYSQYSAYPYLIIATSPLYRKYLFKTLFFRLCF